MGRLVAGHGFGNARGLNLDSKLSVNLSDSSKGCPCGGGDHPVDSHLWTVEQVARPAQRSKRQVYRDRSENPDCPLHAIGQGRGSDRLVWSYDEVRAYLSWIVSRGW